MPILFAFILSLIVTIVLIPILISSAVKVGAYDLPDSRKVHSQPIPRIGGVAMAVGAFVPIIIYGANASFAWPFLAGGFIIVISGLCDDFFDLNWKIKFVAQIIAALVVVYFGDIQISRLGSLLQDHIVLPEGISIFLAVLTIVGVTNALNLADGLDGLAGGLALLMLLCIGYLAWMDEDLFIVLVCTALSGAIFGFLRYNTHPAILFMGDTGSQLLGFSTVCLALSLTQKNTALSPVLPLFILGVPILDTVTVMTKRIAEGRSPFSADKGHFHHRLMNLGLYHSEAVFVLYVIQSLLVASAYLLRFQSEWLLLGGYLAYSAILLLAFHSVETSGWGFPRFAIVDRIKRRLRLMREQGSFIKFTFRSLEIGAFLLMIMLALVCKEVPGYFAIFAVGGGIVLSGVWFFLRERTKWVLARLLYFFIPFLVYLSDSQAMSWMAELYEELYNLSFLAVAALSFMTLRLTRRRNGFKPTTMDYLLLFITLVLIALPELREKFGMLGVKTILLFFACEIVLDEIREKIGMTTLLTLVTFAVIAVKGI